MPMPREDNNVPDNFRPYKDKESTLEMQHIERDYRNLVDKSLDIRSCVKNSLSGHTF